MVEKELGGRNFGFDSLKSRLNHDMKEKGIVAQDFLPLPVARTTDASPHRRRLPRHEDAEGPLRRRRGGARHMEEADRGLYRQRAPPPPAAGSRKRGSSRRQSQATISPPC